MAKQSQFDKVLENINQQIGELQRARQILIDARGLNVPSSIATVACSAPDSKAARHRRTKAEMAADAFDEARRKRTGMTVESGMGTGTL